VSLFYNDDTVPTLQGTEESETKGTRHNAVRHVASMAVNAVDCAMILAMLGLEAGEGKD
jgi:hypothetical protein